MSGVAGDDPSSSSSDTDDIRHLPRGVIPRNNKRRGGWEGGEAMELQRDDAPDRATTTQHAAVDLRQFRNEEVGKGYQAKHVVRQRTAAAAAAGITTTTTATSVADGAFKDMTKKKEEGKPASRSGSNDSTTRKSKNKRKKEKRSSGRDSKKTKSSAGASSSSSSRRLQRYLQCEGLRKFRKELESIAKDS